MPPICTGGLLPAYVILRGRIAVQEKIASPSNLGEPHQTMASSLTNLLYHIVFSTKERIPLIHEDLEEPLYDYIGGILRGKRGLLLGTGGRPAPPPRRGALRPQWGNPPRSAEYSAGDRRHAGPCPPAGEAQADLAVAEAVRLVKSNSSGRPTGNQKTRGGLAGENGDFAAP